MKHFKVLIAALVVAVLSGCAMTPPQGAQPEMADKPLSAEIMQVVDTGAVTENDVRRFLKSGMIPKRLTREGIVAGALAGAFVASTGSVGVLGADAVINSKFFAGAGFGQYMFVLPSEHVEAAYARGNMPQRERLYPTKEKLFESADLIKGRDGKTYYVFDSMLPFAKTTEDAPTAAANLTREFPGSISWSGIIQNLDDCIYKNQVFFVNGEGILPREFAKCTRYVPAGQSI